MPPVGVSARDVHKIVVALRALGLLLGVAPATVERIVQQAKRELEGIA